MQKASIIDGTGLILGRLASVVAKRLLTGDDITIINAEKIVLTKSKEAATKKRKARLHVRTHGSQLINPKHPRKVETIVRRTVRGMLPRNKPIGRAVYRSLKIFMGVPGDIDPSEFEFIPEAKPVNVKRPLLTMEEYTKILG